MMVNDMLKKQHGAALFIALVFLVIITLIGVTAMRTSTLELLMATNEQSRRLAFDSAASATDAVVHSNDIKIGSDGDISCFRFGTNPDDLPTGLTCNTDTTLTDGPGYGDDNIVLVTMKGIGTCPPSVASSARGSSSLRTSGSSSIGGCAYYTIDSDVDATEKRGGRAATREGFIRLAF